MIDESRAHLRLDDYWSHRTFNRSSLRCTKNRPLKSPFLYQRYDNKKFERAHFKNDSKSFFLFSTAMYDMSNHLLYTCTLFDIQCPLDDICNDAEFINFCTDLE